MKILAITMGDPSGIGPEVAVKALSAMRNADFMPIIVGSASVLDKALQVFKVKLKIKTIEDADAFFLKTQNPGSKIQNYNETIWCLDTKARISLKKAGPLAENGGACVSYIKEAVQLAMAKKVDAIVTAPISKEALKLSGYAWPGHTEMLAELTKTKDYAMLLTGGRLKVILTTIHAALKNVPGLIKKERVLKTIRLANKACQMSGKKYPIIAVAGLNPHAGEAGIFGTEELREIAPAIEKARQEGMTVEGPFPPDIVFHKAYKKEVDIVVCMYHDQGLIPLKMLAFDKGVNITVGLPIIRTSPDHGTAYDIAWKGIANPSSMIEAIRTATRLKIH